MWCRGVGLIGLVFSLSSSLLSAWMLVVPRYSFRSTWINLHTISKTVSSVERCQTFDIGQACVMLAAASHQQEQKTVLGFRALNNIITETAAGASSFEKKIRKIKERSSPQFFHRQTAGNCTFTRIVTHFAPNPYTPSNDVNFCCEEETTCNGGRSSDCSNGVRLVLVKKERGNCTLPPLSSCGRGRSCVFA